MRETRGEDRHPMTAPHPFPPEIERSKLHAEPLRAGIVIDQKNVHAGRQSSGRRTVSRRKRARHSRRSAEGDSVRLEEVHIVFVSFVVVEGCPEFAPCASFIFPRRTA